MDNGAPGSYLVIAHKDGINGSGCAKDSNDTAVVNKVEGSDIAIDS